MRNIALELHQISNERKRFYFPFDKVLNEIPENGIYLIFEKGEKYKNLDRIVRIGSHTGNNQLRSRLKQHFVNENKNRSIFRKNIGRCFLNQEEHPYLSVWEFDTTSRANKEKYSKFLNHNFEKEIEQKISKYIQTNLSFCTFNVEMKEDRLFWEKKIISTLAKAPDIHPSENWLGNQSPKRKIRESGLWQVNELNNESLTESEFEELKNKISDI